VRQQPHSHPCEQCGAPVPCAGKWERNDDGWPEAICEDYHLPHGEIWQVRCEDCEAKQERA